MQQARLRLDGCYCEDQWTAAFNPGAAGLPLRHQTGPLQGLIKPATSDWGLWVDVLDLAPFAPCTAIGTRLHLQFECWTQRVR